VTPKAGNIKQTYTIRALRLTLLAPDLVDAILDGRQPEGTTLPGLLAGVATEWTEQRQSPGSAGHAIQARDAAARP
jgi:hypothetical protein